MVSDAEIRLPRWCKFVGPAGKFPAPALYLSMFVNSTTLKKNNYLCAPIKMHLPGSRPERFSGLFNDPQFCVACTQSRELPN
jgi:hypothetical protein